MCPSSAEVRVGAALLFGTAFPLVVYAATAVARYRRLGIAAPGPLMGFAGAVLAAGSVALSALFSWTSAQVAELVEFSDRGACYLFDLAEGTTRPPRTVAAHTLVPELVHPRDHSYQRG